MSFPPTKTVMNHLNQLSVSLTNLTDTNWNPWKKKESLANAITFAE
jgi:hypothetical protein